jgi:hypothetical protein
MTEGHESQEPPFFISGKAFRDTKTVGNDGLDDVVVSQNDSFGITYHISSGPKSNVEGTNQWYHWCN